MGSKECVNKIYVKVIDPTKWINTNRVWPIYKQLKVLTKMLSNPWTHVVQLPIVSLSQNNSIWSWAT